MSWVILVRHFPWLICGFVLGNNPIFFRESPYFFAAFVCWRCVQRPHQVSLAESFDLGSCRMWTTCPVQRTTCRSKGVVQQTERSILPKFNHPWNPGWLIGILLKNSLWLIQSLKTNIFFAPWNRPFLPQRGKDHRRSICFSGAKCSTSGVYW